jgi:CDP-ribitol ribitolphosphotransferase
MSTEFRVESVEWARVNLTFHLRLGWTPRDGGPWEPVVPVAAVPLTLDEGDDEPVDVIALEDVDQGPGGAEGGEADDDSAGDDDGPLAVASPEAALVRAPEPDLDAHLPQLVGFFIRDTTAMHAIDWTSLGDGRYRVDINISNFAERAFLPRGTWKFFAKLDSGAEVGAGWELARLDELDSLTRVFLFAGNRQAYTVSFGLTEDDVNPLFAVRAYSFVRKSSPAKRARNPIRLAQRVAKKYASQGRRRQLAQAIYKRTAQEEQARRAVRGASGQARKTRVLFASEMREGLEGNLLAVRDRMLARGLDTELDLRYSFRTSRTATRSNYLNLVRELARADIVLIDDYFPPFENLKLDPSTRVIQVWHAGSGFKSVGFSRFGKFGSPGLTNAHRKYTYAISASRSLKHVYAEVFGIEEEAVIPTGLPRIDTFLDPASQAEARATVYSLYPTLEGKRVIMFAPTFRGRGAMQASYDYSQIDFQALYDLCGEDSVVAFRMHHFIHEGVPIPDWMRDRFIDVSEYRDGNALLLVTDLLITDYSSIIFEYSLLERPMLFFAYDEEVYSAVRGFHRPYKETAPGKVCHTFDELLTAIRTEDFELERGAAFRDENFDVIDTHSSDRVIDWLVIGDPPESAVVAEPHGAHGAHEAHAATPTPLDDASTVDDAQESQVR